MKKTLIYSAFAAMMTFGSPASQAQERINQIVFDSDERFLEEPETDITQCSSFPKSIFINDVDSVTFDVKNQRVNVYGSLGGSLLTAWYDLARLNGFSFTYLNDGVMPSTMLSGETFDRSNLRVMWRPVEGASGYEIAYIEGNQVYPLESRYDWIFTKEARHITVGADETSVELKELGYGKAYTFAIRVLSPKGEGYHSQWSMRNRFTPWLWDYTLLSTWGRGTLPYLITSIKRDKTSMTIGMKLDEQIDEANAEPMLEKVDGRYVVDKVYVKEANGEEHLFDVTPAQIAAGEVVIDGLKEGTIYTLALYNSNLKPMDAPYGCVAVRTKGEPGAPILIPHKVATEVWIDPETNPNPDMELENAYLEAEQKYQACRLDTVIANYNLDETLMEGQTFMLEGGKAYYMRVGPNLLKGLTLCTDPADLAAGKGRAKVYLGGIVNYNGQVNINNFNLGRIKSVGEPYMILYVDKCVFNDIDFDVPEVINYAEEQAGLGSRNGNYWMNCLSASVPFDYEGIECHNCTFQNFQRGFFRVQGSSKKIINSIVFDGCVFMNLGMYSINGMDYRFIHGEQSNEGDNIAKDIQIINNTFYDCTLSHMVSPTKDKVIDFPAGYEGWSIRIEGNTFINLSTRAGRPFINMRSFPGDSKFTFKRNLICLAKDAEDNRDLKQGGIDLRPVISGSGKAYFDVRDNYSTGCLDSHMVDDGIFTSGALSSEKNSFGYYASLGMLDATETAEDLIVKVGTTPLRTDELFVDPNPKYHATAANDVDPQMHYIDPTTIWDRLQYNSTAKVKQHEIYTKNIGDQRWKKLTPEFFTKPRGEVPSLISSLKRDKTSITLGLNLEEQVDESTVDLMLERVDGRFVVDKVYIKETNGAERLVDVTPAQIAAGEVVIDGLKEGTIYTLALYNSNLKPSDAPYRFVSVRTKGEPGAPILIPHKVATEVWIDPETNPNPDMELENAYLEAEQKYQACRLDTVIANYNLDETLMEGQTFMLEGGKAYYMRVGPNLLKGLTLCTDPADLAAGKGRAKIYLGGIVNYNGQVNINNFNLGGIKSAGEPYMILYVDKCVFNDIDFDVPEAINYGEAQASLVSATGNYWMNCLSGSVPFDYEGIECHNCTFQNFQRGFFRVQGSSKKIVNSIVFDGCVFMNLGMYNNRGMNYRFIHGEQVNDGDNIAKDIQIINNTFYDCTLSHMVSPNKDKVIDFPAGYKGWSIRIEGNTFINLSTRVGNPFIAMRSFPGDSKFTFKRNLICLAKDAEDNRDLKQGGIDLRPVISGSGKAYFDVRDNYSTGCLDSHMVDDGIFTSGALSSEKNSFGYYAAQGMLDATETAEDLIVKVGTTPLRTDELFVDPNPKYHATAANDVDPQMHYIDPTTIWERLKYNTDAKVTQHEIFTKNIGDQRWKTQSPEFFTRP